MGALIRASNWSATSLGPPETWPHALKTALSILLNSKHQMFLAWGPDLISFYNDAYRSVLGARHPKALGCPFPEIWADIWPSIAPLVNQALAGEGTWSENLPLVTFRNGFQEIAYFTFSYSPIFDDSGEIAGMFCACTETTDRMLAASPKRRRANAIRASEGCLSSLFQQAPSFMAVVRGPTHIFEMANAAHQQLVGFRPIIGKPVWEALPEIADQGFARLLDQVYATGQPYIGHGTPVHVQPAPNAPSALRYIDFIFQPIGSRDGSISGIFIQGHDVTDHKRAEAVLATSEERYRALLEASAVVVWFAAPTGEISHSQGWTEFSGLTESRYDNMGWIGMVHPDDQDRVRSRWQEALSAAGFFQGDLRIRHKSGEYRWMHASAVPIQNPEDCSVREWVGCLWDIHDREQAIEGLRESEERLRLALQAGRMIAWEVDLTTNHITRSQNSVELLGIDSCPAADVLSRVHPEDREKVKTFVRQAEEKAHETVEFRFTAPDGKQLWLSARAEKVGSDRIVGVAYDISDRKAAEEEIWRSANHDTLTGLPNRTLFQKRLEEALDIAKENDTSVSLILIDFDHFKEINDALGHDAGDAFLKETANRLRAITGARDTAARFSGDEFAILLTKPTPLEHASKLAESLVEKLSEPMQYRGRMIGSKASIGVAAFPEHDTTPADLLKDADIALFEAKAQGRNRVVTYHPSLRTAVEQRISLLENVRDALPKHQIVPFYQPKVCLSTGRITGLEVLARWRHPEKGILSPAYFGAAFEEPKLALALSESLLAQTVSDLRQWLDAGLDPGRVAFNLSACEFIQPGLTEHVFSALESMQIPTERFEVEVTETVLLSRNTDTISTILNRFHDRGISIALDDFGTGFASLTHLKQFPVEHIKIDRSFVRDLEKDPEDEAIVAAIITLGQSLSMRITAEGVETAGQAKRLRDMGCHNGQGYLFAKAVAGVEVPQLLAQFGTMNVL
jgi:diguanylate cyclase (GGDEF)-like protein/PAS domain S-box-containing protein